MFILTFIGNHWVDNIDNLVRPMAMQLILFVLLVGTMSLKGRFAVALVFVGGLAHTAGNQMYRR
ncbi:hypothetical protein [Shewanella algidipiscicola]|uniref:hypothetical protein n=1 Tax=Shewanella algidipiscicola TaxID=614070 RepID=UPI0013C4E5D6|nr:hypothetical protein [Shewanella algidipiscicola]